MHAIVWVKWVNFRRWGHLQPCGQALWSFYGHRRGCLNNPIFSNLGLCAACWAHFMCHHELWPTSVGHPFSFLSSSWGLTGGKHYQKNIITIFRFVLQNFTIPGYIPYCPHEVGRGHRNDECVSVRASVHASIHLGFLTIIWKSNHSINFKYGVCIYLVSVQNWFAFGPCWPNFVPLVAKKMTENGSKCWFPIIISKSIHTIQFRLVVYTCWVSV